MKLKVFLLCLISLFLCSCANNGTPASETLVLRIANMEEYIDEGRWEDEIELSDGTVITSKAGLIEDFAHWYEEEYGEKIRVEYATVGTNEELYNLMSLGNTFDLVCPSEYMIMKLLEEDRLVPLSDTFLNPDNEDNYYVRGVSPFISDTFGNLTMEGKSIRDYTAGYMWGSMGMIYDPAKVSAEDMSHWSVLCDPKYYRQITMKDSVRDSLFVSLCILNEKQYLSPAFISSPDYRERLALMQNDTSEETVKAAGDILSDMRLNSYAIETDSARADMVSRKAAISMQWSGDAVYILDVADESDVELCYSVPEECTNLWFDGWVMMKNGINEDARKQRAAEAFLNFISRPDNVIRNMNYIGYTSVISGGDDSSVYDYLCYCYEAEDDEEDTVEYDLSYFFPDKNESLTIPADQAYRQLFAQYPTEDVINRSVVMRFFDEEARKRVAQMWIDIRCFDLKHFIQNKP